MANSFPVVLASDESNVPANITQVAGATISLGQKTMANSFPVVLASDEATLANPLINQPQIQGWIINAQAYTATTTKLTAAGAITGGLSIFNPNASGKTLLIYSITFMIGNNSFNQLTFTTVDPALGTLVTAHNNKAAGAASVAVCSSANTNVTPAGTTQDFYGAASNAFIQVLAQTNAFIIPANNGIAFYSNLSGANSWVVSMSWIEF